MNLDLLTAISPVDGRYRGKTEKLADYFSEFALIRYRVRVEIEYFITLCELPLPQLQSFDQSLFDRLRDIYRKFSEQDAQRVKDIEKVTNHDVKAVEYFIKEQFAKIDEELANTQHSTPITQYQEFIHFGLTSQDINNTSVPLSIKAAGGRADSATLRLRRRMEGCADVGQDARAAGFSYPSWKGDYGICVSSAAAVGVFGKSSYDG